MVIDETMACLMLVISTSTTGEIRDRIEDGTNGYIVAPQDSNALADRMLLLAADPQLRARMGAISAKEIAIHTPER
jgi:glycosyltransferase involved in cell wall biosynthesis